MITSWHWLSTFLRLQIISIFKNMSKNLSTCPLSSQPSYHLPSLSGPPVSSPHPAAPCTGTLGGGALNTSLTCNITLMSPSISFKWRLMKSEGRRRTAARTNSKHMWLLQVCLCVYVGVTLHHTCAWETALVQLWTYSVICVCVYVCVQEVGILGDVNGSWQTGERD